MSFKFIGALVISLSLMGAAYPVQAQLAGSSPLGVEVIQYRALATGWSVKKTILGQPVYNEQGDKIGTVDDVIIAPDKALSYAIVGTGGFLGMAKHDVLIPVNQFKQQDAKLILPGATKKALKDLPEFEYAK